MVEDMTQALENTLIDSIHIITNDEGEPGINEK